MVTELKMGMIKWPFYVKHHRIHRMKIFSSNILFTAITNRDQNLTKQFNRESKETASNLNV